MIVPRLQQLKNDLMVFEQNACVYTKEITDKKAEIKTEEIKLGVYKEPVTEATYVVPEDAKLEVEKVAKEIPEPLKPTVSLKVEQPTVKVPVGKKTGECLECLDWKMDGLNK